MNKRVKLDKRYTFRLCLVVLLTSLMSHLVFVTEIVADQSNRTYTVQAGDTLWEISQRFKVEVAELKRVNHLRSDVIQIGQTLTIPIHTDEMRYIVQKGDSLWEIAQRFGLSIQELITANRLDSNVLQIGQILTIPKENEMAKTQPHGKNVTVQAASVNENEVQISYTNKEFEWLTRIIEAEAANQPYEGKVAVGSVVLNRVHSDQFPNSIRQVIFQKTRNVYQFTPVGNGRIYRVTPSEEAIKAARAALGGEDPTNGALFFYNPRISSDRWIRSRTVAVQIGQHTFAY